MTRFNLSLFNGFPVQEIPILILCGILVIGFLYRWVLHGFFKSFQAFQFKWPPMMSSGAKVIAVGAGLSVIARGTGMFQMIALSFVYCILILILSLSIHQHRTLNHLFSFFNIFFIPLVMLGLYTESISSHESWFPIPLACFIIFLFLIPILIKLRKIKSNPTFAENFENKFLILILIPFFIFIFNLRHQNTGGVSPLIQPLFFVIYFYLFYFIFNKNRILLFIFGVFLPLLIQFGIPKIG